MTAIVRAMTWEFWRRSGWSILQIVIACCCLLAVLLLVNDFDHEQTTELHAVFLRFGVAAFVGVVLATQGSRTDFLNFCQIRPPTWLYTLPVPNWMISGLYMIHSMVAVSAMYWVTVLTVNLAFRLDWPLLGPSIFIAVVTASVQGAVWLFSRHPRLQLAVTISLIIPFFGWVAFLNRPDVIHAENWRDLTPELGLAYGLCIVVGYVMATLGVMHDRRGFHGVDVLFDAVRRCGGVIFPNAHKTNDFASRRAAQKFYARRRASVNRGWWIPLTIVALGCLSVPLLGWLQIGREVQHAPILATIVALAMCVQAGRHVLAIVFATRNLSGFEATRPLTDSELANSFLSTILRVCSLTALTLLLCQLSLWWGTAIHVGNKSPWAAIREFFADPVLNIFTVVYSAIILWIVPWTASTMMWPMKHAAVRHRYSFSAGILTFFGLMFSMAALSGHPHGDTIMSKSTREILLVFFFSPLPAASVAWAAYANWKAASLGLIGGRTLVLVCTAYLFFVGMHVAMWLATGNIPSVGAQLLAIGLSALPFSSPASVHLVVAADRHR